MNTKNKKVYLITYLFLLSFQSCFIFDAENKLVLNSTNKESFSATLSSLNISNNQLTIQGSSLSKVTFAKIQGNGVDVDLAINSKNDSQIIANATSALSLLVDGTFNLIIGSATGQTTYPVTFTLPPMGATTGQVLKFNGSIWEPGDLTSSQTYIGTWNANTQSPALEPNPNIGDYYIVNVAGTYTTPNPDISLDVGDWLMYNGAEWDKVPSGLGSKLSLTGGTISGDLVLDTLLKFKGATKYVTLKASSSLASDITLTLPMTVGSSGQLLTTDGSGVLSWTTPPTSTSPSGSAGGDLAGSYPNPTIASGLAATKIADGSVSNAQFQYLSGLSSNIQTQLDAKATSTLTNGNIFIGNASNVATSVAISGDATLSNTGALTINTVSVAKGGTGLTTGLSGGIPYYSTASTMASTSAGSADQVLRIPGAGGAPAFGAIDLTKSAAITGALSVANGGTGLNTIATNQLLYGSGPNTISGLSAPSATTPGVLLSTAVTGIPAWTTSTAGNVLQGSASGVIFGPLTNITPGADFSLTQNSSNPFTSINAGALPNTLYLKSGNVGIGTATPNSRLAITSNSISSGTNTVTATSSSTTFTTGSATTINAGDYLVPATTTAQARGVSVGGSGSSFTVSPAFSAALSGELFSVYPPSLNIDSGKFIVQGNTGNVGIGTITPRYTLDVNGTVAAADLRSTNNLTVTGSSKTGTLGPTSLSLYSYASGTIPNLMLRYHYTSAGAGTVLGSLQFAGNASNYSGNILGSIVTQMDGAGTDTSMPTAMVFSTTPSGAILAAEKMRINSSGNVGIGVSNPTTKLQVAGDITPGTSGSYSLGSSTLLFSAVYASNGTIQTSDARSKKEILESNLGLNFISQLRPVSYRWKTGPDNDLHYGLIAQEVEKTISHFNSLQGDQKAPMIDRDKKSGKYGLRYSEFISPIIKSIQELYGKVKSLQEKDSEKDYAIASLKKENKMLKIYLCSRDKSAPFCQ